MILCTNGQMGTNFDRHSGAAHKDRKFFQTHLVRNGAKFILPGDRGCTFAHYINGNGAGAALSPSRIFNRDNDAARRAIFRELARWPIGQFVGLN